MNELILIAHGVVAGSAFYLGFFFLLFMTSKLVSGDEWDEKNQSALWGRYMTRLPYFVIVIGGIFGMILIFILSFTPAMLALAFGPAYFFDISPMFRCDGTLLASRTGVTELSGCMKSPVWVGVIASVIAWFYLHFMRPPTNDDGSQE